MGPDETKPIDQLTIDEKKERRKQIVEAHIKDIFRSGSVPRYARESVRKQLLQKYFIFIEFGNEENTNHGV